MKAFSVKVHGRAGLTYREDVGSIEVDSEMLNGKFDMVIYVTPEMYWNGDLSKPVSPSDKCRVIENLHRFMAGKGMDVDWQ